MHFLQKKRDMKVQSCSIDNPGWFDCFIRDRSKRPHKPQRSTDKNTVAVLSVVWLDTSCRVKRHSFLFSQLFKCCLHQHCSELCILSFFKVSESLYAVKDDKKKHKTFIPILNGWFRHPQQNTSQGHPICLHLPVEHVVNLGCRWLRLQTTKTSFNNNKGHADRSLGFLC